MWLLDTSSLELKEFSGEKECTKSISTFNTIYAILSHTWGLPEEEVSFRELRKDRGAAQQKPGYRKAEKCCSKAAEDGFRYAWIDTCCIDKRSSAELSEAINSMFKWYQNAQVCYVYLTDVLSSGFDPSPASSDDAFSNSRWFKRGWTLQELIAPRRIQFFASDWVLLGAKGFESESVRAAHANIPSKDPFVLKLAKITGVREEVLRNPTAMYYTSVAQKMSWAARRHTTRGEDLAYALMGLFGVHMPILYGEGQRSAFKRLQLEIIKVVPDQSIFAWRSDRESSGLLADSPANFANSGAIQPWSSNATSNSTILPYSMTNAGISINLSIKAPDDLSGVGLELGALRCWANINGQSRRAHIVLRQIVRASKSKKGRQMYRREQCHTLYFLNSTADNKERRNLFVLEDEQFDHVELIDGFRSMSMGNREDTRGGGPTHELQ